MTDVPTNYEGPVCNLNSKLTLAQPMAPTFPQIPVAMDQASTQAAVNTMRQILLNMLNPSTGNNTLTPNNPPGSDTSPGGTSGEATKPGDFNEVPGTRQTKKVKVSNPQDANQFVMVEQVTGVTFKNKQGQTLKYKQ